MLTIIPTGIFPAVIIPNVHPMLVHFPIALISVSAIFHLLAKLLQGKPRFASTCALLAHSTLWFGALAAIPTAIFGYLAFNSVNHDDAGHAAMLLHRAWALVTLGVLLMLAGWDVWRNKVDAPPATAFIAAVLIGWGMLGITAWHGAELVYRHGLGVLSMPAAAPAGNAPEHQHQHEHEHQPESAALPASDATPAAQAKAASLSAMLSASGVANSSASAGQAKHSHAPGTMLHRD